MQVLFEALLKARIARGNLLHLPFVAQLFRCVHTGGFRQLVARSRPLELHVEQRLADQFANADNHRLDRNIGIDGHRSANRVGIGQCRQLDETYAARQPIERTRTDWDGLATATQFACADIQLEAADRYYG